MNKRRKLVPENQPVARRCHGGQSIIRRTIVGAIVNLVLIAGRYLLWELLDR